MNEESRKVLVEFGPDTWFESKPVAALPYREVQENGFERLKSSLLRKRLDDLWEPEFNSHLRRAANEAAALARVTAYPTLVFPELFEEKVRETLLRSREHGSTQRSRRLLTV